MPRFSALLYCLGRALVKNAGRGLARLVPLGEALYDVAVDTYEEYRRNHHEAELRGALAGLAQASPVESRQAAAEVAVQAAADQPSEVRDALTSYLSQVPASIRHKQR